MKFGLQDPSRIAIKAIETIQMPKTQTIIYYDLEFEKYANQIQDNYYSKKALPIKSKNSWWVTSYPTPWKPSSSLPRSLMNGTGTTNAVKEVKLPMHLLLKVSAPTSSVWNLWSRNNPPGLQRIAWAPKPLAVEPPATTPPTHPNPWTHCHSLVAHW